MTKDELFALTGLPGVIDTALPQAWYDAVYNATGLNPIKSYVWYYPPGSMCGVPLGIADMFNMVMDTSKLLTAKDAAKVVALYAKTVEEMIADS